MYKTYIDNLTLLSDNAETNFWLYELKHTCFNGVYPFKIFPAKGMHEVALAPITIFYGGTGKCQKVF